MNDLDQHQSGHELCFVWCAAVMVDIPRWGLILGWVHSHLLIHSSEQYKVKKIVTPSLTLADSARDLSYQLYLDIFLCNVNNIISSLEEDLFI